MRRARPCFSSSSTLRRGLAALGLLAAVACAPAALAQECGDVNDSGKVTTSDALAVLRKSVGQDVALVCAGDCVTLAPRVTDLEDALASTQASLSEVQDMLATATAALADMQVLLAGVSRTDDAIVISGANLQVVDGTGFTAGPTNGLGNVIIGYNERTLGQARTGSHNLIVGEEHAYSGFGGIVAGEHNAIAKRGASVVGGKDNIAGEIHSTVCGGSGNVASGPYSSVGGGFSNIASGTNAAISGGCENNATNTFASVSGGQGGTAGGAWSSVSGGYHNSSTGSHSSVSGGSTHAATAQYNWKAGGLSQDQ